ncbi:MAG: hypothetical protein R3B54_05510 [Bdellovibrionota bacterium]
MDAFLEPPKGARVAASRGLAVFCPPIPDKSKFARASQKLGRRVYRWLYQKHQALYLSTDTHSLNAGALPGPSTLLNPNFPHLTRWILAQAGAVISFEVEPVVFAKTQGIPAVFLSVDKDKQKQAASNGIRALSTLEELKEYFSETLFSPTFEKIPPRPFERAAGYTFCAMSDWGYASQLVGWLENLRQVETPMPRVFILTFQKGLQTFIMERFPHMDLNFVSLGELWNDEERPRLNQLALAKQAYASKARLLRHVLRQTSQPVFYSDVDLFFIHTVKDLVGEFGNQSLLLFPHWSDSLRDMHRYGMFNAGLLGVRPGAERFLDWWAERCLEDGLVDRRDCFYDDQGYLDLVPLYFETAIHRGQKHNLGPWCLQSTEKTRNIHSFHASQPDPLGFHELKALWDQACAVLGSQRTEMAAGLEKSIYVQQSCHWDKLNRLYRFSHYLPYRLGLSPYWIRPKWQKRFSRLPFGGSIRKRDYFYRSAKPPSSWIRWQQKHLHTRTELNSRFKNSLARAQQGFQRIQQPMEN